MVVAAGSAVDNAVDEANKQTEANGGISTGAGPQDASADVGTPAVDPPEFGLSHVRIPVTNNSSKRSDYWIEMSVTSADGATQYDTTIATLSNVEPGQSATAETVITKDFPADALVKITEVQRTASL
jgi:hypothetical protein